MVWNIVNLAMKVYLPNESTLNLLWVASFKCVV